MGLFASELAETATTWRKAVAPYAEQAARIFWQGREKKSRFALPTRLTQARRSLARAGKLVASIPLIPKAPLRCPICGGTVTTGSTYCANCVTAVNRENLLRQAKLGRIATHSATAEARRAATHRKQVEALKKRDPTDLPKWLDEDFYRAKVMPKLPKLPDLTVKKIRTTIDVSHPYAAMIRRGDRIPHPRHWLALAQFLGISCPGTPYH